MRADPTIRRARSRMLVIAARLDRGRRELVDLLHALEAHPDFVRTENAVRARHRREGRMGEAMGTPPPYPEAPTLAWVLYDLCLGTLQDAPIDEAPRLLRNDARTVHATRRIYVADQAEDFKRAQRQKAA